MSTAGQLSNRRDAAIVAITRMWRECKPLDGVPLDEIDESQLKQLSSDLTSAMAEFKMAQDGLTMLDDDITEDDHQDVLEATVKQEKLVRKLITPLTNRYQAATIIHGAEAMLAHLEHYVSVSEYDEMLDREMDAVDTALTGIRTACG